MRPLQQNDVFHAIAHPARRTILVLLKGGEKPASELAEPFGISFAAVSQHLKILKEADLVSERREGRQRIYHLQPKPLREVMDWVDEFETYWNARLDALSAQLDRKHGRKKRT
jgi:DNA-binding transcriptional ArsR family regulator